VGWRLERVVEVQLSFWGGMKATMKAMTEQPNGHENPKLSQSKVAEDCGPIGGFQDRTNDRGYIVRKLSSIGQV
jgi:hypothetical protein